MTSAPNFRAGNLWLSRCALFFLLAALSASPSIRAQAPQSSGTSSGQQLPAQDPAKRDPTNAATDSATGKTKAGKPHRVFTNDDLSPSSGVPIAPGAYRRLKQLNRCDRACFVGVEKQAFGWGYSTTFPRSTRQEMEDRLANDIVELQSDAKWQRLLLEMISAHIDYCSIRQKSAAPDDPPPPHTPTRAELLDEEERMRNPRPVPPSNWNTASSAVLAYRFSTRPDPLKASLMVHYYMDELHQECSAVQPATENDDAVDP